MSILLRSHSCWCHGHEMFPFPLPYIQICSKRMKFKGFWIHCLCLSVSWVFPSFNILKWLWHQITLITMNPLRLKVASFWNDSEGEDIIKSHFVFSNWLTDLLSQERWQWKQSVLSDGLSTVWWTIRKIQCWIIYDLLFQPVGKVPSSLHATKPEPITGCWSFCVLVPGLVESFKFWSDLISEWVHKIV